jgi:hypothetical protein
MTSLRISIDLTLAVATCLAVTSFGDAIMVLKELQICILCHVLKHVLKYRQVTNPNTVYRRDSYA